MPLIQKASPTWQMDLRELEVESERLDAEIAKLSTFSSLLFSEKSLSPNAPPLVEPKLLPCAAKGLKCLSPHLRVTLPTELQGHTLFLTISGRSEWVQSHSVVALESVYDFAVDFRVTEFPIKAALTMVCTIDAALLVIPAAYASENMEFDILHFSTTEGPVKTIGIDSIFSTQEDLHKEVTKLLGQQWKPVKMESQGSLKYAATESMLSLLFEYQMDSSIQLFAPTMETINIVEKIGEFTEISITANGAIYYQAKYAVLRRAAALTRQGNNPIIRLNEGTIEEWICKLNNKQGQEKLAVMRDIVCIIEQMVFPLPFLNFSLTDTQKERLKRTVILLD